MTYEPRSTSYEVDNGSQVLVGGSPHITTAREFAQIAAQGKIPAHIAGESGTGKELVARLIHRNYNNGFNSRPFMDLNCAAMPGTLIESELFGYQQGAFTDAKASKPGLLEKADHGILFLDEIGEIEKPFQMKLIRALEYGFRRLGGLEERRVDTLIVTADSRGLEELMGEGVITAPFFYRVKGVTINLPPLRNRREDIPILVNHYLEFFRNGRKVEIDKDGYSFLQEYDWPGNIRQLKRVMQLALAIRNHDVADGQSIVLHRPDLEAAVMHLSGAKNPSLRSNQEHNQQDGSMGPSQAPNDFPTSLYYYLERGIDLINARIDFEKHMIQQALTMTGGDKTRAAALLGIDRNRVYNLTRKSDPHKPN